jgi:predicted phosphodiesterase
MKAMHPAKNKDFRLGRRFRRIPQFLTMPLRFLARPMTKRAGQLPLFKPDFTFVHMTDVHLNDSLEARLGFQQVVRRVNELSPDFVLSGGDQIYDAGFAEHSRAVRLFENYRNAISDLRCPIYHVIGNHDHFGHGRQAHYAGHADYGKQLFLDQIGGGRRYRSFTRQNWHFILLDTSHFQGARFQARVDDEQFEWLRRELQSLRRGTHAVVVTHVPLLTRLNSPLKGRVEFPVRCLSVAGAKKVRRLLHENNVRLVLQGHIHAVEQLRLRNTWYVNSGAVCGRWWQGSFVHCPMGFTVVSVKGDQMHWRFETIQPPNS